MASKSKVGEMSFFDDIPQDHDFVQHLVTEWHPVKVLFYLNEILLYQEKKRLGDERMDGQTTCS